MRITYKQLKKLPVETKSGKYLGRVCDVVFEIDGQLVAQHEVRPSLLSGKKYLISRDQVLGVSAEKMIVSDGVVEVGADEKGGERVVVKAEGVVMREIKEISN